MKKKALGISILLALFLLAGTAIAHRSGGLLHGYDADEGYGFCDRYSDVDRDEVKAITAKYADQLDILQEKMDARRDQMHKARDNDATTMGQLNSLRDEMFEIRQEYRALAGKIDDELGEKFGDVDNDRHYGILGDWGHRSGKRRGGWRGWGGCR
jgi:hypothetical protein